MTFNKIKAMESALRTLNQGRVAQAIGEYQQILRHDPNDQVVLMTVGDLFVRQGNMEQAIEYFERLAQLYLNDGFNSKAIAIYKKISKLAPAEIQPLERLADLYVQQGVLSEARPLFLQIAEHHLKGNRAPRAVESLRRLLEVEPDNPRIQQRLAELYQAIGQKKEAAQTYLSYGRRQFDHGELSEALKWAELSLSVDAENQAAIVLKSRVLGSTGRADEAVDLLSKIPGAEPGSEIFQLLIDMCLKAGKVDRAATLARKAAEHGPAQHAVVFQVTNALLEGGEAEKALELIGEIREAAFDTGEHEQLSQALTSAAERLPGRLDPLEWLVDLYGRTSDSFHLPDAMAQLADACTAAGKFERAEALYKELLERNPESEHLLQRLNRVRAKMGRPASAPPAETGPLKPPAPRKEEAPTEIRLPAVEEPPLDEDTQRYLAQALTDVDLFSSYGLTQKAIQLLENVLQRAPRHTPTLERLLDLSLGAGNDRRTAELAALLERIHLQRGDRPNGERFGELRRRFQRAAGLSEEELEAEPVVAPPTEIRTAVAELAPSASETVPATPPAVQAAAFSPVEERELDLSEELVALSPASAEAPPLPAPTAATPIAAEPRQKVEAQAPAEAEPAEFEIELVASSPETGKEEHAQLSVEQFLNELVAEVEGLQASTPPAEALAPPARAPSPAPAAEGELAASTRSQSTDELSQVFQEFRAELGELGEEDEDLETHYNLGIAYREMALLDEAIGEFQKVARATQCGRPFRYTMQCATLLALSFMEKNEPKIASLWYKRALETPGLDQETILALRYDLGVAEEMAGNTPAALESFHQVYAINIDYRDVAERIAALQKQ